MARTVAFYRDVLGMPLVKTIDLPGGRGQHFFFDIGNGDTLAFFWFPGGPESAPGVASPSCLPGRGDIRTAHGSMNHSLVVLGSLLSKLGQHNDALAATSEAVTLHRQLAARSPDTFRPELAGSLTNLANRLNDVGQREDALTAAREAVELRRELAAQNPNAFQSALATSLNTLGSVLSGLRQSEPALAAIREAIALCRQLVTRNPDACHPLLAVSLNNLSAILSGLRQHDEALAASREADPLLSKASSGSDGRS